MKKFAAVSATHREASTRLRAGREQWRGARLARYDGRGRHTLEFATFSSYRSARPRSEEHTSELQSLMRNSYAVFCLKKKKKRKNLISNHQREKAEIRKLTHNTNQQKHTVLPK